MTSSKAANALLHGFGIRIPVDTEAMDAKWRRSLIEILALDALDIDIAVRYGPDGCLQEQNVVLTLRWGALKSAAHVEASPGDLLYASFRADGRVVVAVVVGSDLDAADPLPDDAIVIFPEWTPLSEQGGAAAAEDSMADKAEIARLQSMLADKGVAYGEIILEQLLPQIAEFIGRSTPESRAIAEAVQNQDWAARIDLSAIGEEG